MRLGEMHGYAIRKRLNNMLLRWKNDERMLEEIFRGTRIEVLRDLAAAIDAAENAVAASDVALETWSRETAK